MFSQPLTEAFFVGTMPNVTRHSVQKTIHEMFGIPATERLHG